MSRTDQHPFPNGQTYLSEEEKAQVRAELAENNASAQAARAAAPRGPHPKVAALRDAGRRQASPQSEG